MSCSKPAQDPLNSSPCKLRLVDEACKLRLVVEFVLGAATVASTAEKKRHKKSPEPTEQDHLSPSTPQVG